MGCCDDLRCEFGASAGSKSASQGSNGHKGKPTPQEAVKAGESDKDDILDREIIDPH